jgi:hypothetical protein
LGLQKCLDALAPGPDLQPRANRGGHIDFHVDVSEDWLNPESDQFSSLAHRPFIFKI